MTFTIMMKRTLPHVPRMPHDNPGRPHRRTGAVRRIRLAIALTAGLVVGLLYSTTAWAHGKAHQHGVATMDLALVGTQLTIELDSPLDNLVGFERAVRTPAEQARVDAMARTLRAADTVFKPDAAARCTARGVTLEAPVVGLSASPAAGGKPGDGHADLVASFTFECAAPEQLRQIDVGLFSAFKGFKKIDVQMVRDGRQGKRSLTPAAPRLALPQ